MVYHSRDASCCLGSSFSSSKQHGASKEQAAGARSPRYTQEDPQHGPGESSPTGTLQPDITDVSEGPGSDESEPSEDFAFAESPMHAFEDAPEMATKPGSVFWNPAYDEGGSRLESLLSIDQQFEGFCPLTEACQYGLQKEPNSRPGKAI